MIKRVILVFTILILSCSRTDREYSPTGPTASSAGEGNLGGSTRIYTPGVKGSLVAQPDTITGGGVITITVNDEDEAGTEGVIVTAASSRGSIIKKLFERRRGLFQGVIEVGGNPSNAMTKYKYLVVNTSIEGDTVVITYLDNRNDEGKQEIITASVTVQISQPQISPSTVTDGAVGVTYTFTVSGGTAPYSWSFTGGSAIGSTTGQVFKWKATSTGTFYITVTDTNNLSDTATVEITTK
jgi:hypothetical protein